MTTLLIGIAVLFQGAMVLTIASRARRLTTAAREREASFQLMAYRGGQRNT